MHAIRSQSHSLVNTERWSVLYREPERGPCMAQVKKEAVREAILAAALRLFRKQGYIETTLSAIAAAAKTSRANIYVYFPSKFALFYAVFDPWLQERLAVLERELARIADPR